MAQRKKGVTQYISAMKAGISVRFCMYPGKTAH